MISYYRRIAAGAALCILFAQTADTAMTSLPLFSRLGNISATETSYVSIPPGNWRVDQNLHIPTQVSIRIQPGAHIQIKKGSSLRIDGQFSAPNRQVFTDNGTVKFGDLSERVVNPTWWGAQGTGCSDDTMAIQSAIDSINTGEVLLDAGVFLIAPIRNNKEISFLAIKSNVTLSGAGIGKTILKVIDKAGSYHFILSPTSKGDECFNFKVRSLTMDSNISNNPIVSENEIKTYGRKSVAIFNGHDISIDSVEFRNDSSMQTIALNGVGVHSISITNCLFTAIGNDPNSVSHDHSSIYTHASRVVIDNNKFISAGIGKPGARTAIETHGSDTVVTDNQIFGYLKGMNITGISHDTSRNVVIRNNRIVDANYGIHLWSNKYRAHISGYGFDGIKIIGNNIQISQTKYPGRLVANGIFIGASSDLPVSGLDVSNNNITFELEGYPRPINAATFGIGYATSKKVRLDHCVVRNNRIVNVPTSAIRFSCILNNVQITGNTIVNPGSSLEPSLADQFRSGIYISSDLLEKVTVEGNSITYDLPQSRVVTGVFLGRSVGKNSIKTSGNTLSMTDTPTRNIRSNEYPPLTWP